MTLTCRYSHVQVLDSESILWLCLFNSLKALLAQHVLTTNYKKSLFAVFVWTQSNLMVFCVLKAMCYKLMMCYLAIMMKHVLPLLSHRSGTKDGVHIEGSQVTPLQSFKDFNAFCWKLEAWRNDLMIMASLWVVCIFICVVSRVCVVGRFNLLHVSSLIASLQSHRRFSCKWSRFFAVRRAVLKEPSIWLQCMWILFFYG